MSPATAPGSGVGSGTACPVCGSSDTPLFHPRVWSLTEGRVYRCRRCGLAFILPHMTNEQEKDFYRCYNEHVKRRGVTAVADTRALHEQSRSMAQRRRRIIESHLAAATSLLEIGAATGAFLELNQDKVCFAVEPSEGNRDFSTRFCRGTFSDISEIPNGIKFDLICMFHVFEHIKGPQEFLAKCKDHLCADGAMVVQVPSIEDPLIGLYRSKAYMDFYFQPMHPFVYSPDALRMVFKSAGFHEWEVLFRQMYGLDNHLTWLVKGVPGGDDLFTRLHGDNSQYIDTLERTEKTDNIFYVAGLKPRCTRPP